MRHFYPLQTLPQARELDGDQTLGGRVLIPDSGFQLFH